MNKEPAAATLRTLCSLVSPHASSVHHSSTLPRASLASLTAEGSDLLGALDTVSGLGGAFKLDAMTANAALGRGKGLGVGKCWVTNFVILIPLWEDGPDGMLAPLGRRSPGRGQALRAVDGRCNTLERTLVALLQLLTPGSDWCGSDRSQSPAPKPSVLQIGDTAPTFSQRKAAVTLPQEAERLGIS